MWGEECGKASNISSYLGASAGGTVRGSAWSSSGSVSVKLLSVLSRGPNVISSSSISKLPTSRITSAGGTEPSSEQTNVAGLGNCIGISSWSGRDTVQGFGPAPDAVFVRGPDLVIWAYTTGGSADFSCADKVDDDHGDSLSSCVPLVSSLVTLGPVEYRKNPRIPDILTTSYSEPTVSSSERGQWLKSRMSNVHAEACTPLRETPSGKKSVFPSSNSTLAFAVLGTQVLRVPRHLFCDPRAIVNPSKLYFSA